MNKPSQFVFLPTDKESRIAMVENKLRIYSSDFGNTDVHKAQHLYILSDDEVKEGDWVFDLVCKTLWKAKNQQSNTKGFKKIIGTTNPELTKKIEQHSMLHRYKNERSIATIDFVTKRDDGLTDLEYMVSLYNGKGKEVSVENLATNLTDVHFNGAEKDCEWICYKDGIVKGYNQCLQDNADKKFTLVDIKTAYDAGRINEGGTIKSWDKLVKFLTKEQSKTNTVMVEYEEAIDEEKYKKTYYSIIDCKILQPKLKDGNICIVR